MHNIKGSQLKMLPQSTRYHLKIYIPYTFLSPPDTTKIFSVTDQHLKTITFGHNAQSVRKKSNLNAHGPYKFH